MPADMAIRTGYIIIANLGNKINYFDLLNGKCDGTQRMIKKII